jgi:hypothetical protein
MYVFFFSHLLMVTLNVFYGIIIVIQCFVFACLFVSSYTRAYFIIGQWTVKLVHK